MIPVTNLPACEHTAWQGTLATCLNACALVLHFRAKWPTSCDSPRSTSTSAWWSVSWSSAASMRNLLSSPTLSQTLWVDPAAASSQKLWSMCVLVCVWIYSVSREMMFSHIPYSVLSGWKSECVLWGHSVPFKAGHTLMHAHTHREHGCYWLLTEVCPPYPCLTSLAYFSCSCFNFFSESLSWKHCRFSLHHDILVVHEVGSHCSLPLHPPSTGPHCMVICYINKANTK